MQKPVTQSAFNAIMLDSWPTPAGICDFGIDSQEHYEALHGPIRSGELTIELLDMALGNGPVLTFLVNNCQHNPHKGIVFQTACDMFASKGQTKAIKSLILDKMTGGDVMAPGEDNIWD